MFIQPSISPKPFQNPCSPLPLLFFFPKTLHFQHPKLLHNNLLLLRASAADTQTLPQSAIQRIADKLRSLGYVENNEKQHQQETLNPYSNSPGEIFVPLPNQLPKHRVGHTIDQSWSTPENPVPDPGSGNAIRRYNELRREVWKAKREEKGKRERENVPPTLVELKLSGEELRRLRGVGIGLKKKLKIGKAGITEGIVNGIHERWRRTELVKIVCEDMCRMNMKRTHDLLERKTGGLVIWRSGSNIILYRGADYKYPYFIDGNIEVNDTSGGASLGLCVDSGEHSGKESYSSGMDSATSVGHDMSNKTAQPPLIQGVGSPNRVRFQLPGEAQLVEEADHLLQGLGPRFNDWYGYDPVPVDADLLPAIVPGYRRPFRLLPYGVKPKLTNDEMTTIRRLGRPLPCHFALGRNRKLQGLAASILKLWEKCEIAKIAVKRGVQNTNSELMAEELKRLTGGTVLTRDKEYIVLYRGKDFLPATVSSAIEQRRNHGGHGLERKMISSSLDAKENKDGEMECSSDAEHGGMSDQTQRVGSKQRKLRSHELAITRTSAKLSLAFVKKERAENLLAELEKEEIRKQLEIDKEGITEEERYMLRKVGLRMKPFLLLGRRGVFDGTVENMHLHWKYRELVKILSGEKSIVEVHAIARTLEAESGGILVAVERVSKGHAIIVYRGKNYKRPASLRPQTLLNKREALKRSIEAQRRESLKLHVLKLSRNVDELKLKLARDKETVNTQSEKDLKLQLEMKRGQSAEYIERDADLVNCKPSPTTDQDNVQARESHGDDFISFPTKDGMEASKSNWQDVSTDLSMVYEGRDGVEFDTIELQTDASRDSVQARQRDVLNIPSIMHVDKDGSKLDKPDSKALSELLKRTDVVMETDSKSEEAECTSTSTSCDDFMLQGQKGYSNIPNAEPRMSVTKNEVPFRAARLSNRERLLLRKQALKMQKRPVLAVGRSNIVTGVAKTIMAHFQKHPLAIVNIKGRARGTSVQEVVSKLEEATGAVLVSQEPSKVILYRGWGATKEEPGQTNGNSSRVLENASNPGEGRVKPIISPELISAIRLECGLPVDQEGKSVP